MLLFSILLFYSLNPINKLKKSIEGTWFLNCSITENLDSNLKIKNLFLSNKTFQLKVYENNFPIKEYENIFNYTDQYDIFCADFLYQTDNTMESSNLDPIQRYIISFSQNGLIYFHNLNSFNEKIQIKLNSSNLPHVSISGKYSDKYVFHFLRESETKMHLSIFMIENVDGISDFSSSWIQLDFIKDIDRSPPTLFEKNFPFMLLASIFIIGYCFGFYRQNKRLNLLFKKDDNYYPKSDPVHRSKDIIPLKVQ